ncbi:60S ribosomal protein L31 [Amborella trichopoda]|uniref:60S ribosomal protein L31 n=1 Tax=Amborella trichopoda TaxID=13333 RepID=UPI0005D3BC1A|nr:60S ribosomal protein L31 [Amborella trichopoda]|eukprot:XP_011625524.1 60S ribosomal protein L31 [Amborella trichopoda]
MVEKSKGRKEKVVTTDVRVDVKLNKHSGIRGVPRRVRDRMARKRRMRRMQKRSSSLVTVAEIPPEVLKRLGIAVIDEAD